MPSNLTFNCRLLCIIWIFQLCFTFVIRKIKPFFKKKGIYSILALSVNYRNNFIYPRFIEAQGRGNKRMHLHGYFYILLLCLPCIVYWDGELWLQWKWILWASHFVDRFIFMPFFMFVWRGKKSNMRMGTIKYLILYLLLLTGIRNILCLHITYFRKWSMFMGTNSSSEHFYACMWGSTSWPSE